MEQNKLIMVSLFGEDHYESDEEIIRYQQDIKRRIHDAIGSDSESEETADILEIEYTDISDEEESLEITHASSQDIRDSHQDKSKNFAEAKRMTIQSVGRIQVIPAKEKTVYQRKALAQYRRQMAAKITKYQIQNTIRLPDSIILTNELGQPVKLEEGDILKDEDKTIQEADRIIQGKNIVETLRQFTPQDLKKTPEPEQAAPIGHIHQPIVMTTSSKIPGSSTTILSRKERRQRWYQKKTSKSS